MIQMFIQLDGEALANFRSVVFLNYRKLVSPTEMLISLIELYCTVPKGENQAASWRKIIYLLEYWITHHFQDFHSDEIQLEFFSFLEDLVFATLGVKKFFHFFFFFFFFFYILNFF